MVYVHWKIHQAIAQRLLLLDMVFAHLIIRLHIVQHQGLLVMGYVPLQTHQAIAQRRDQLGMGIAQVLILHRIVQKLDLLLMECAL